MEDGEAVVITRDGQPVAQLTPPPAPASAHRKARLGTMRGSVQYKAGWDDPTTCREPGNPNRRYT